MDHLTGLVCLCAKQAQGEVYPGKLVVRAPLTDDAFEIVKGDIEHANRAAAEIDAFLRDRDDGSVALITCIAGQNRSSWVAAKVLMLRFGWSADESIKRLEETRDFRNWFFKQELKGEYTS